MVGADGRILRTVIGEPSDSNCNSYLLPCLSIAAQEMLERRRETIAKLRQQGVLVVETTPAKVGASAISKYLEVKAQGLL